MDAHQIVQAHIQQVVENNVGKHETNVSESIFRLQLDARQVVLTFAHRAKLA